MKVKNINGTSQTSCTCGSWLQHWENFSGQSKPRYCTVKSCMKIDLVGVPVQKADGSDEKWYIFPMCSTHSHARGTLEVSDHFNLVPAARQEVLSK